jgi:hypothetical protein
MPCSYRDRNTSWMEVSSSAAIWGGRPFSGQVQLAEQRRIQVPAVFPTGPGLDRNPGCLQPRPDSVPGGVVLPGDLLRGAAVGDVPAVQIRWWRHYLWFRVRRRGRWPVDVEFSSSHGDPPGRHLVLGTDGLVVQEPGDLQLGQGWFCPNAGGGGACGSGRRGIPCRRNAAFTLVVVVARTAATSRTVLPSST